MWYKSKMVLTPSLFEPTLTYRNEYILVNREYRGLFTTLAHLLKIYAKKFGDPGDLSYIYDVNNDKNKGYVKRKKNL